MARYCLGKDFGKSNNYEIFSNPSCTPLTPPEKGGEHTIQGVFQYRKSSNRSIIYRPPLQKGDKEGINWD